MDIKTATEAVAKVKSEIKKRNFTQTFDLILNLKDIDIKKIDGQIDIFHTLSNPIGKPIKICALVGAELIESAKETFDEAILVDDFPKLAKNKKEIKLIAEKYDFFIAQANLMGKVAQTFGRVLGPKGKMPNQKQVASFLQKQT